MAMNGQESTSPKTPPFENILIQVHFDDPQEVAKKETGEKLAEKIYGQQWSNSTDRNFFAGRAAHQLEIENWSLGKQDMMQFLSYMGVNDANKSEANIDMTPIMIGAQFSGTLVESISKNVEYPFVSAVDDGSMEEKEQRKIDALFRMHEVETINEVQKASGIQVEPTNAYVPDSELGATIYFEQKDQLPKEIKFQKILSKALLDNQYERVLKPKLIRHNVVFNTEVIKVGRGENEGEYIIKTPLPKNVFYNYFQSDNGNTEISYIGEAYNLKVRDIRNKFGKSDTRQKGLTEQEVYDLAKLSAQNNPVSPSSFNHEFGQQHSEYSGRTAWDDFSIFTIDFEIKISESKYWVSKTDSFGKENITSKKGVPKTTSEKSKVIMKPREVVYRGVYAPYAKKMIFWGKAELVNQFSYSINIPFNTGEYIPSLFERALEPMRELALVKLKKKLLIARLRPAGFRFDIEGARNITLGNGNTLDWEEALRIFTVTGVEIYSSRGLNPLESSNPTISSAGRDDTLQSIIQLDQTEKSIEAGIRVLLGVPVYLDGSNVGQRTAAKLSEGQRESSSNVTGFIQNSHSQVIEEALGKICYMAWQDVVTDEKESSEDLINTKFKTFVKMRMTDDEKMILEGDIQRWGQTPDENGMPLISPADAYAIRQIDDLKLAEMYLADKIDENRRKAAAEKQKREEFTFKSQKESNTQAAENAAQLQADKLRSDKDIEEFKSNNKKQEILLEKGIELYKVLLTPSKGADGANMPVQKPQLPEALEQLLNMTFQNIAMTLSQDSKIMGQQIQAEEQEEQMMMEQQQMEAEGGQEEMGEQQNN